MKKFQKFTDATNGKIYVYLANEKIGKQFLQDAEAEGYTFGDRVKPTKRNYENIIAVNSDKTINYVGTNGRIAYQCNKVTKIDYRNIK